MDYCTFGRSGLRVSRLNLGAMTFGAGTGIWQSIAGLDGEQTTRRGGEPSWTSRPSIAPGSIPLSTSCAPSRRPWRPRPRKWRWPGCSAARRRAL